MLYMCNNWQMGGNDVQNGNIAKSASGATEGREIGNVTRTIASEFFWSESQVMG